ncbi:hypothetical protein C8T65DRAFT_647965 [Cerioporus squamosus]|nr:hypothetical protein C8T65DRAFT_647965 [Cerioporus squamosus]
MESLAPELLHEICSLACTDGGFTGCSLSLVNKHIRDVSRSPRFNSVAIFGPSRRFAKFLICFNKERATAQVDAYGYKPVVKHLFIAAQCGKHKEGWRGALDDLAHSMMNSDSPAERFKCEDDIAELIRLVSRDLRTLCFVYCNEWHEINNFPDIECPEGFPELRELYLYEKNPFVGGARSPICFPQLTHLHILFSTHGTVEKLNSWAHRAPEVTHLCVRYVTRVTQELTAISAGGGPFKKLSRLYLEPRGPRAPGHTVYPRFKPKFDSFLAAAVRPTKALPYYEYRTSREEAAMKEWLDRVGGGTGCWGYIPDR